MRTPITTTIRSAKPEDILGIRALEQRASTAAHWSAQEYGKLVSTACVLIAEHEGQICGMLCAKALGAEWELENIVVAEEFQRRGVADSLMVALLDQVRRDAAAIFLEVRESNRPARQLYEKHGFRESGRRRNYHQNPLEDAILYARPIR